MRRSLIPLLGTSLLSLCLHGTAAVAQRHNGLSSPPTARPPHSAVPGAPAIVPVSAGLGALQFFSVNYGVPAPQSLTRQLQADDDRTRSAALSAIGAPSQYLGRGHVPFPHTVQLDFIALGVTDELDAILTVELDQHMVSAILIPEGDTWHRIASIVYATSFADPSTTPSTFLRIARSLIQHERYRAVYRATTYGSGPGGPGTGIDFTENEAQLRVLNNKAVILVSFVSSARTCIATGKQSGCALLRRWLQPNPIDPGHQFLLITGTGRLTSREADDPLASASTFQQSHLRAFTCQPYLFSDATQHYEPTANAGPCPTLRHASQH